MNELSAALKIVLSNTFVMYQKAQIYHWNVEGPMFAQYHDFFADIYGELLPAIDIAAEQMRALDTYAPFSILDMVDSSTVKEDRSHINKVSQMLNNLLRDNEEVIRSLDKAFSLAEKQNKQGLMDFFAARLDAHAKHNWMIKAHMVSGD